MIVGSGFLIISFVLIVAQWISASRAGCPLCRTPVLVHRSLSECAFGFDKIELAV
jgi:hypothetical protein